MSFSMVPPFPARKAIYDIAELKIRNKTYSPCIPKRRCAEIAMPVPKRVRKSIDVREGVWQAVFGDLRACPKCSWIA